MSLNAYYVFVDWQNATVHADGPETPRAWDYTQLRQTLWKIHAENSDDALRLSVKEGLVEKLICKTEEQLRYKTDYITQHGGNHVDPTVPLMKQEAADEQKRLTEFKAWQEKYQEQIPIMQTPAQTTLYQKHDRVA